MVEPIDVPENQSKQTVDASEEGDLLKLIVARYHRSNPEQRLFLRNRMNCETTSLSLALRHSM